MGQACLTGASCVEVPGAAVHCAAAEPGRAEATPALSRVGGPGCHEPGRAPGARERPKWFAAGSASAGVYNTVGTASDVRGLPEGIAAVRRAGSMHTSAILIEEKPVEGLLRDLEHIAGLLQLQYQNILRHPDTTVEALQRSDALMRKVTNQVRRMKLREANTWQMDDDNGAEEWVSLFGSRKRFQSLHDVVKQVQLEGRIIRRWRQRFREPPAASPRSFGALSRVSIDSWEAVDVFRLEQETHQPLTQVFMSIWSARSVSRVSKASADQASELARAIEAAYRQNPYHNRKHAAEVTACAYYLWSQLAAQEEMKGYFTDVDLLAVVVAAAVHDLAHPGKGNDFLVKTQHTLAIRYSDRSVLEHFHAASAFALIKDMNVPVLEHSLPSPPAETLKGRVVDMVLATDMAQHRRIVEEMAAEVAVHKLQDVNKIVLEQHLLHLSDIGHSLRPRAAHREWSKLIREEFFAQGDEERRLGLQPTPLCDREKAPTLAKSQQGFLSFVVVPTWRPMQAALGPAAAKPLDRLLADNQAMWEELAAEERAQEEKLTAAAAAAAAAGAATADGRRPASPCRPTARPRKQATTVF